MTTPRVERLLIEAMAKHLPPSGASLRLVDVGGRAGAVLAELRADLDIVLTPGRGDGWQLPPESLDAVVGYDCAPEAELLETSLVALRPGGRLILMNPQDEPGESWVKLLQAAGFTRILVETGAECPMPVGALLRGEKPHTQERTVDRIRQTAQRDDGGKRAGRYVYLLVRQTPNKPAWKLEADEPVAWQAMAVAGDDETVALAFSSLPKAVEFMQPAVLAGQLQDVNKVAKFSWETARAWPFPMMLNPSDEIFDTHKLALLTIDPATAEAPDE